MHIFSKIYEIFSFRSLKCEVFDHFDLVVLNFVGQGAFACKLLNFLVQLEAIVAGTGTENTTAAYEKGRVDVTDTGAAATFLLVELTG